MTAQEASAKQNIFNRIRSAKPTRAQSANTIAQEAQALLELSSGARPPVLSTVPSEALTQRVEQGLVIGTTCEQVDSIHKLPSVVASFLAKHGLPSDVCIQNTGELKALDWSGFHTDIDVRNDHSVGVCLANMGVAETGSYVIESSKDMPILLNFLPLYLVVAIPKSKIVANMDEWALQVNAKAAKGENPRNLCLISGASGTTDIEGVLVQGAHGPEFQHLVIVDDL